MLVDNKINLAEQNANTETVKENDRKNCVITCTFSVLRPDKALKKIFL